jgi:hypothetical protein
MERANVITNIGTRIANQAGSQTIYGGMNFYQPAIESRPYPTTLISDAVFLQEYLLVRDEVYEFLLNALQSGGKCRTVLYGLPGVG